ncbi:MAG: FG-GAP repeat protein, partial [Planctomycetota bacterium]
MRRPLLVLALLVPTLLALPSPALPSPALALQTAPGVRPITIDPSFPGGASVDAADFDGDGRLDLAGSTYYGDEFVWWRQTPEQTFERYSVFPINTAFDLEAADLDGDGDQDLYGSSLGNSQYGED